ACHAEGRGFEPPRSHHDFAGEFIVLENANVERNANVEYLVCVIVTSCPPRIRGPTCDGTPIHAICGRRCFGPNRGGAHEFCKSAGARGGSTRRCRLSELKSQQAPPSVGKFVRVSKADFRA